jgi:hypothetical protein
MKLLHLLTASVLMLSLAAGTAFAQSEKAKKQVEIRKVAQTSLERFYKADPKLKGEVAKAPGYGVFTSYGFTFLLGGSGGKGLAHDATTKKDTFMDMAQVSAGLQVGGGEFETLIVFKTAKALSEFVTNGWEFAGGGRCRGRRRRQDRGRHRGRAGHRRRAVLHADQERTAGRRRGRRDQVLEGQGAQLSVTAIRRRMTKWR